MSPRHFEAGHNNTFLPPKRPQVGAQQATIFACEGTISTEKTGLPATCRQGWRIIFARLATCRPESTGILPHAFRGWQAICHMSAASGMVLWMPRMRHM